MLLAHLLLQKWPRLTTWTGGNVVEQEDIVKGSVYHYQFIDHGAQYRVYAILTPDGAETNRVIKVPLTFNESKQVLQPYLSEIGLNNSEVEERIHQLMLRKQQLPTLLQGMFARDKKLVQLLGNLKLIPQLIAPQKPAPEYMLPLYYTQDYVVPMAQFMHRFRFAQQLSYAVTLDSIRQARQLFHEIVNLHYTLWSYGISDTTFKLENVGVVMQGEKVLRAVLVDGAEHTYDLDEVDRVISERRWSNCLDPSKSDHLFLPTILHKEYATIMQRSLTKEALHRHWQKKSGAIERRASQLLRVRQLVAPTPKKKLRIWIEQQNLHETLYQGMPQSCIDMTSIPYADLQLLFNDTRADKTPLDTVVDQEKAERTMYANNDKLIVNIRRHTPHISYDAR